MEEIIKRNGTVVIFGESRISSAIKAANRINELYEAFDRIHQAIPTPMLNELQASAQASLNTLAVVRESIEAVCATFQSRYLDSMNNVFAQISEMVNASIQAVFRAWAPYREGVRRMAFSMLYALYQWRMSRWHIAQQKAIDVAISYPETDDVEIEATVSKRRFLEIGIRILDILFFHIRCRGDIPSDCLDACFS